MIPIIKEGAFDSDIRSQVNANFQQAAGISSGNLYFLDPLNGADLNSGLYPSQAVKTLAAGYALLVEGHNDVLVLIGNGLTTASARLSVSFTWSKNAAHLVGVCAPGYISNRARIAPTAGATAYTPMFTLSGSGCFLSNVQWFHGFGTGTTSQIGLVVSGGRNVFDHCAIDGIGDAASAASAGSRSLKISTTGENYFRKCSIGLDTVSRGAANASLEFSGGCPRNVFEECLFPLWASASTPLGIIVSAAAGSDRFQYFNRCVFINAIKSTGTIMSGLATLAASMGGMLVFKDCTLVGVSSFGTDSTSLGQIYVDGAVPTGATTGVAVNAA